MRKQAWKPTSRHCLAARQTNDGYARPLPTSNSRKTLRKTVYPERRRLIRACAADHSRANFGSFTDLHAMSESDRSRLRRTSSFSGSGTIAPAARITVDAQTPSLSASSCVPRRFSRSEASQLRSPHHLVVQRGLPWSPGYGANLGERRACMRTPVDIAPPQQLALFCAMPRLSTRVDMNGASPISDRSRRESPAGRPWDGHAVTGEFQCHHVAGSHAD